MANTIQKIEKQMKKQVATSTAIQLRLLAQYAQEELDARRNRWVHDMYEQFCELENSNMATAIQVYRPDDRWTIDRVVVTYFTDKNRSKVSAGVSRLSPNDIFDYRTGVAIAFARAQGKEVPDLF